MSLGLVIRSILALALGVAVAALGLTHAAIPPAPALGASSTAVNGGASTGNGVVFTLPPTGLQQRLDHGRGSVGHKGGLTGARPAPTPRVILPSGPIDIFNDVPGHIFFVDPDHNIDFVTNHSLRKPFTADGASVAPALSPDGLRLAFVEFKRNYSDIVVLDLRYSRDGGITPLTPTLVTQDQSPPLSLEYPHDPTVYDPRYEWWAQKPAWLPNGQNLVYLTDRPGFNPNPTQSDNATLSVWEQGLTDPMTNAVRLTTAVAGTGGHDSPEWRPRDPAVFLYVDYVSGTGIDAQGMIQAALVPPGGPAATNGATPTVGLTPHGATEYQPAWSPDGHDIAFVEDKGNSHSVLKIMPYHRPGRPLDYYKAVTVARGAPFVAQPFWSPGGRYIGYLVSAGDAFNLVIRPVLHKGASLSFGRPETIAQAGNVGADYRPTWTTR